MDLVVDVWDTLEHGYLPPLAIVRVRDSRLQRREVDV